MAPRPAAALAPRALLISLAILLGSALLGIVAGLLWSAIAPQALFMVASRGVAYVVNPETSAFIAADGYFSIIAVAGGALIGLAAYLAGVRRFGPIPAAAALAGATAAAFLAYWAGSNVGLDDFRHRLAAAKPGVLLRQPAQLGAHGALAFWPLAAGAVVGGIELLLTMRERQRRQLAAAAQSSGPGAVPLGTGPAAGAPPVPPGEVPPGQYPAPGQYPGAGGPEQRGALDGHGADGHRVDGHGAGSRGLDGYGFGQRAAGGPAAGPYPDGHRRDGQAFDGQPGWRQPGPAPDPSDS